MFKGAKISCSWAYNIHGLLLDHYIKLLTILKHTEQVHKSVKIDTFYCQSHIKFLFFYPLEQENKLYLEMVLSASLALFITEYKIQIFPANCIWVKLIFFHTISVPLECTVSDASSFPCANTGPPTYIEEREGIPTRPPSQIK